MSVVVLGESSAVGVPYESWFSVGKIVAWQLEQAIPGKRFRLELVAELSDTLAGQIKKLAGVRRRPDLLIVYGGQNEFGRLLGSPRLPYYLDDKPSLRWGQFELAGRVSPLCGLIRETADAYRAAVGPARASRPPLVDIPAYTSAQFVACRDGFHRGLDAIADYGKQIGALTVLVVPPSNDADVDPNRSFLPAETPRSEREAFARDFLAARHLEDTAPARAVERYQTLLDRQPTFAETHYRLARLLARAQVWDEAYRHFVAARDLDGSPTRCLSSFQEICREVAARHQCILVDGQALFRAVEPHGLLDDLMFQDAVHLSLQGQIALAQGILEALYARRAFGWAEGKPAPRSTRPVVLPTSALSPRTGRGSAPEGPCSTPRSWTCGSTAPSVSPRSGRSRKGRKGSPPVIRPRQSACRTSGSDRSYQGGRRARNDFPRFARCTTIHEQGGTGNIPSSKCCPARALGPCRPRLNRHSLVSRCRQQQHRASWPRQLVVAMRAFFVLWPLVFAFGLFSGLVGGTLLQRTGPAQRPQLDDDLPGNEPGRARRSAAIVRVQPETGTVT